MTEIKLSVAAGDLSPEGLKTLFEREVDDYSAWLARLPDWKVQGPLSRGERALLLTYLMQKYKGQLEPAEQAPPMGG